MKAVVSSSSLVVSSNDSIARKGVGRGGSPSGDTQSETRLPCTTALPRLLGDGDTYCKLKWCTEGKNILYWDKSLLYQIQRTVPRKDLCHFYSLSPHPIHLSFNSQGPPLSGLSGPLLRVRVPLNIIDNCYYESNYKKVLEKILHCFRKKSPYKCIYS